MCRQPKFSFLDQLFDNHTLLQFHRTASDASECQEQTKCSSLIIYTLQLFTNAPTRSPVPISVLRFNVKNAHSLSGLVTFASTEEALEALALLNHSPISDPGGNGPYILKLTFSDTRK